MRKHLLRISKIRKIANWVKQSYHLLVSSRFNPVIIASNREEIVGVN